MRKRRWRPSAMGSFSTRVTCGSSTNRSSSAQDHAAGGTLLGPGPNQVHDPQLPRGLRTVDGSFNNLVPRRPTSTFRRRRSPVSAPDHAGLPRRGARARRIRRARETSYTQKLPNNVVYDSQPRIISNLIVDQSPANPAAVAAARNPCGSGGFVCSPPSWTRTATPIRSGLGSAVHPEHHAGLRPVGAVQPDVHVLRPVLRPRPGPRDQGRRHGDHAAARRTIRSSPVQTNRRQRRRSGDSVHGHDPRAATSRARTACAHRHGRRYPGRHQPDDAVGRSEPDLHLASRRTRCSCASTTLVGGQAGAERQGARRRLLRAAPTGLPGDNDLQHRQLGRGQGAGGDDARHPADRQGRVRRAAAPDRPVRPLQARPERVPAARAAGQRAARGQPGRERRHRASTSRPTRSGPAMRSSTTSRTTRCPDSTGSCADRIADTDVCNFTHLQPGPGPTTTSCSTCTSSPATAAATRTSALTTVHQIFHSEHNRLGYIDIDRTCIEPSPTRCLTPAEIARGTHRHAGSGWDYGERLFQAARFGTEMQYQHLVFEEFARKIQPLSTRSSAASPRSTRRSRRSSPTRSTASATRCCPRSSRAPHQRRRRRRAQRHPAVRRVPQPARRSTTAGRRTC